MFISENVLFLADAEGLSIRIPSLDDLIQNKKMSGRKKDLVDVEALEAPKKA